MSKQEGSAPASTPAQSRSAWVFGRLQNVLWGALGALIPLLLTLLMKPDHRSPYLLAYPAVVISAWFGGVPAALGCAITAGMLVEHFFFVTHRIVVMPSAMGGLYREGIFIAGTLMVGLLTRSAARERERIATSALRHSLALNDAERRAAADRERAGELARENEARVLMALDGANAGLFEWNITQDRSTWSDGFYRLHDLPPGSEAHYRIWRARVHPEDLERVERELLNAVRDAGRFSSEYRVIMNSGEVRWVDLHGSTELEAAGGRAVAMTGYCGDVTRRKLSDLAMLQSEKLALAGRLSAAVAHEIKDPLEAATNLVYLSRQDPSSASAAAYLEEAMQQLARIADISRQTLRFTRSTDRSEICLASQLVGSTLQLLKPKLLYAGIKVETQFRSELPFVAAPGEVEQVFTNLLNNALDALEGLALKRIRISVRASRCWAPGPAIRGVRISFADTGTGMSAEVMRRMREPFFTTKQGTGTGLGMWVVSELLAKYGGSLAVSSSTKQDHRGTVVSIFLPMHEEVQAHPAQIS